MSERDSEYVRWYPLKWQPLSPSDLDPKWRPHHSNRPEWLAVYIHFPFCSPPCAFCPYLKEQYTEERAHLWLLSVRRHIELLAKQGHLQGRQLRAIYWGGGTPSLAQDHEVKQVMRWLGDAAALHNDVEISFEARPRKGVAEYLLRLRDAVGLTRCSLGVQTFDSNLLHQWGGHADLTDIKPQLRVLSKEIVVAIDLLYGGPDQSALQFHNDLLRGIDVGVDQISVYEMILTPDQALWQRLDSDRRGNAAAREMYDIALDVLPSIGLQQVVVSDFARPGKHGIYQLEHWRSPQLEVLGLGPAAISYCFGYQFASLGTLDAYAESIARNRLPVLAGSQVSKEEELCRNLTLGVKAIEIDLVALQETFPRALAEHASHVAHCQQSGWLECNTGSYRLTTEGMWYVDNVSKGFYSRHMQGCRTPDENNLVEWTARYRKARFGTWSMEDFKHE